MAKYYCTELGGLVYLPHQSFKNDEFFLVPATQAASAYRVADLKGIVITRELNNVIVRQFVFCYQFLFPNSEAYYQYSQSQNRFEIDDDCDDKVIAEIKKRYNPSKKPLIIESLGLDFEKLDQFHTRLFQPIDFRTFHQNFVSAYTQGEDFKNIIDLLLHAACSRDSLYDNLFQKIAHIQTVFETLTGQPPDGDKCETCGKNCYKVTWKEYLQTQLNSIGISEQEFIDFVVRIKGTLNRESRVKFVHNARQYNVWQERMKSIRENQYTLDEENRSISAILKLSHDQWSPLNWENIFRIYLDIVRYVILKKYLGKNDCRIIEEKTVNL